MPIRWPARRGEQSGGAEVNDLSATVTWANVPNSNITQGSVTQHEAAIDHDALANFVANEHVTPKHTIEIDVSQLQLVNDLASPGNDKHYGTSAAGVKGWYTIPTGGAEVNDLGAAVTWANIPIANVPTGTTGSTVSLGNHGHVIADISDFTDNSSNWDTAFGWGNHASGGYSASAHTHDSITDTNLLDKTATETITGLWNFTVADSAPSSGGRLTTARLYLDAKDAITGADTFLRLNNAGNFTSGVFVPNNLRIDGEFHIGASGANAKFTSSGALTALSYGGITEANLLDKSAAETITGAYRFDAQTRIIGGNSLRVYDSGNDDFLTITHSGTGVLFQTAGTGAGTVPMRFMVTGGKWIGIGGGGTNSTPLRILDGAETSYVDLSHDSTDFNIAGTGTTDLNITGITAIKAGTVDADFDAITATSYGGILEANLVDATGAFHDGFSDFVQQEHIRWDLTGAENIHADRLPSVLVEVNDLTAAVVWADVPDANVTEGSVTQHVAAIDHDALLNFVADEHLDWTADAGADNIHVNNITGALSVTSVTVTGGVFLADSKVSRPLIEDYAIQRHSESSASGVLDLNMALGNAISYTFTENVTSVTVTNPPGSGKYGEIWLRLQQHASAAKTIAWPTKFHFPGGIDHVMSSGVNDVDLIHISTIDSGTTYLVTFVQDMS